MRTGIGIAICTYAGLRSIKIECIFEFLICTGLLIFNQSIKKLGSLCKAPCFIIYTCKTGGIHISILARTTGKLHVMVSLLSILDGCLISSAKTVINIEMAQRMV